MCMTSTTSLSRLALTAEMRLLLLGWVLPESAESTSVPLNRCDPLRTSPFHTGNSDQPEMPTRRCERFVRLSARAPRRPSLRWTINDGAVAVSGLDSNPCPRLSVRIQERRPDGSIFFASAGDDRKSRSGHIKTQTPGRTGGTCLQPHAKTDRCIQTLV